MILEQILSSAGAFLATTFLILSVFYLAKRNQERKQTRLAEQHRERSKAAWKTYTQKDVEDELRPWTHGNTPSGTWKNGKANEPRGKARGDS